MEILRDLGKFFSFIAFITGISLTSLTIGDRGGKITEQPQYYMQLVESNPPGYDVPKSAIPKSPVQDDDFIIRYEYYKKINDEVRRKMAEDSIRAGVDTQKIYRVTDEESFRKCISAHGSNKVCVYEEPKQWVVDNESPNPSSR